MVNDRVAIDAPSLHDVEPGQQTYVVPWAILVRRDGSAVIDLAESGANRPRGTVCLLATRIEDGWVVRPDAHLARWIAQGSSPIADGVRFQPVSFDIGNSIERVLPDHLHRPTLERMAVGDAGYAVPWAMTWDGTQVVLNPNYTIRSTRGGTAQMEVSRTEQGYQVDAGNMGPMSERDWERDTENPYRGTAYIGTGRHAAKGFPSQETLGSGNSPFGETADHVIPIARLTLPEGQVSGRDVPMPQRVALTTTTGRWGIRRVSVGAGTPTLREALQTAALQQREAQTL